MKMTLTRLTAAAALLGLASVANVASASSYKEIEVTNGGSITGSVSAGDAEPETKTYVVSKDIEICGEAKREVEFVKINNGMLMNAVVFLEKVKEGKPFAAQMANLTLNQKQCEFSPFLGVIENKGELTAINSDDTLHNIHTYELIGKARRTLMNVSQPNMGDEVTKEVKLRKGNGMKVECDAHDFMHSFVFVARSPYYSVVDDNGGFSITDIPPGEYKIRVWHGTLGEVKGGKVTVDAGGEATVDLSY